MYVRVCICMYICVCTYMYVWVCMYRYICIFKKKKKIHACLHSHACVGVTIHGEPCEECQCLMF